MADLGAAVGAVVRPVAAGMVIAVREGGAVEVRAGQYVVAVRAVAPAIDKLAGFTDRVFLAELVVFAVQVIDVGRNLHAVGVVPGPVADSVSCVDRVLAVGGARAQVGPPGFVAGTGGFGQHLAVRVGARQATEIRAIPGARAGQEKAHVRFLRVRQGGAAKAQQDEHPFRLYHYRNPPVAFLDCALVYTAAVRKAEQAVNYVSRPLPNSPSKVWLAEAGQARPERGCP